MSFNTVKATAPSFLASVPSSLTAGVAKIGVSIWLRWNNRISGTAKIFGSSESSDTYTLSHEIMLSSTKRLLWRVALDNGGVRLASTALSTTENGSADVWNHWWFFYDSSLGSANMKCYLNGVDDSGATQTPQLPIWTVGSDFNLGIWGTTNKADGLDFGEIALYAGATLPAYGDFSTYREGGDLPAGYVLRLPMIGSPDATVYSLADTVGPYTFSGTGSGTLTDEIPGITPSVQIRAGTCLITPSGDAVETQWETTGGTLVTSATKAAGKFPSCRLNSGSWTEMPYRVMDGPTVRWVIPAACRPTSGSDVVDVDFPMGLVKPSEAAFSASSTETPTNNYGNYANDTLPAEPRAVLGTSTGLGYASPMLSIRNMAGLVGPWRGGTTLDSRGVPIAYATPGDVATASVYAWDGGAITDDVYVLWKGSVGSTCGFYLKSHTASDTVTYGGATWYRRTYSMDGTGRSFFALADGSGNTNVTDFMIVRVSDWAAFAAGTSEVTPEWIDDHAPFTYIRWMDVFDGVNCNSWDVAHTLASDHVAFTTSTEQAATITAIEATSDPDGYFSGGSVFKVTTSVAHGLHNGQRVNFRSTTSAFPDTTLLTTQTGSIRVNVAGYANNEVEVWVSKTGGVTNVSGGEIYATITLLPHPHRIAAFHNELYAAYARCTKCWINVPHAATDEWVTDYCTDLHAELNANVELWLEYSNETWNSAFEGQWRYTTSEGILLGMTQHEFHAHRSYEVYKLAKAACSGRVVRLVNAGQSVTSSTLNTRMTALQAEHTADTDPDKGTWANLPVIMSTSNYHDGPNTTTGDDEGDVNQVGVPELSSSGVAELYDWGIRDYSDYAAIISSFGKPMYAYEGGFNWDTPSSMSVLTRAVFAGQLTPVAAYQHWANFSAVQAAGFTGVCINGIRGGWVELTGKSWSLSYSYNQLPGLGDGSDGLYDNIGNVTANLDDYRADGTTGWSLFVSPRFDAVRLWGGVTPTDTTVRGFRSPFPWLWGMIGQGPVAPGYTIVSVHDYIGDLHGRIDVLGFNVTGTLPASGTTIREQTASGTIVTVELDVEA